VLKSRDDKINTYIEFYRAVDSRKRTVDQIDGGISLTFE
jgi:hypothetical protein